MNSKRRGSHNAAPAQFVEVASRQGRLRGIRGRDVAIFRGIPYAGSASGPNRFKAPGAPPIWSGVRDAIHFGAPSIQEQHGRIRAQGYQPPLPSEDCLFLNVWTPATDGKHRPVMVYSHGGGFISGSGGSQTRDGANLARTHDVVVVSHNHRLGLLGLLKLDHLLGSDYPSNLQLRDILAALQWVQDNISAFGGDPGNVFVFGESGGGGKTSLLHAMPVAQPLFHRAAIHSSIRIEVNSDEVARATTRTVLDRLGIAPGDAKRILQVPADELLKVQLTFVERRCYSDFGFAPQSPGSLEGFWPWVDGELVPDHPWSPGAPAVSAGKPLLMGTCREEMSQMAVELDRDTTDDRLRAQLSELFIASGERIHNAYRSAFPQATPGRIFQQVITDVRFWADSILITERKASLHAAPVWSFRFAYENPVKWPGSDVPVGSPHASEIPLIFLNHALMGDMGGLDQSAAREKAARDISALWAGFARTGVPRAPGLPEWPAYDLRTRPVMYLSEQSRIVRDPDCSLRQLWEDLRVRV